MAKSVPHESLEPPFLWTQIRFVGSCFMMCIFVFEWGRISLGLNGVLAAFGATDIHSG
jgi:hypothetical protein